MFMASFCNEKNNVGMKSGLLYKSMHLSFSLSNSFSADAGSWFRYFSPCWEAEIEGEKNQKRKGKKKDERILSVPGNLRDPGDRDREDRGNHRRDNAVRRTAQGKLNQVVFVLVCILKASGAGSGLVWGDSLCSTMGASSDRVSGDGLGLAWGPAGLGLGVADGRENHVKTEMWTVYFWSTGNMDWFQFLDS